MVPVSFVLDLILTQVGPRFVSNLPLSWPAAVALLADSARIHSCDAPAML